MLRSLLLALVCWGLVAPGVASAGVKQPRRAQVAKAKAPGAPRNPIAKGRTKGLRTSAIEPADQGFFTRPSMGQTPAAGDGATPPPTRIRRGGSELALALKKGIDRSTIAAAYQTPDGGQVTVRMSNTATHGRRVFKVIGRPARGKFVLQDEAKRLLEVTPQDDKRATTRAVELAAHQFIDSDRILTIAGDRILHEGFREQALRTPEAGYVAPDGTRILRRTPLAQGGPAGEVEFVRDAAGQWLAKLTWHVDAKLKPLKTPSVSLLSQAGVEYRSHVSPATAFIAANGDVLQYRQGQVARPPPVTKLSGRELTWTDGSYALIKLQPTEIKSPRHLVVDRFGVPRGMADIANGKTSLSNFTDADFAATGPHAVEADLIQTTAKKTLPDGKVVEVKTAALRLAGGRIATGRVIHKTDDTIVLTDLASKKSLIAMRRDGAWHPAQTAERFVDAEGVAWDAVKIGASDGDVDYVMARTFGDQYTLGKAAIFARTHKDGKWAFEPAPTRSGASLTKNAAVTIIKGEAYRIVSQPSTEQSQTETLIAMLDMVGARPSPPNSANPLRLALHALGITTPEQWKSQRQTVIAKLRAGRRGWLASLPGDVARELTALTNPSADEFPFTIGIKSPHIGTPMTIGGWNKIAGQELNDYHPTDLAFFKLGEGGKVSIASIGELREFFDRTLGHKRRLVRFDDLARPADVQVIDDLNELRWDAELVHKARAAAADVTRAPGDKLIMAYDACGNVAARRLDLEHDQEGHPTAPQWQRWLGRLPLLTTLQSAYFAHAAKKNNASFGPHAGEGARSTHMGFMPGGYNEYTGLRRLAHESLGHGTERMVPLMQTMLALTAYLDAAEGTNFMERNYPNGPWEQHTTNLEAYMEDSTRYFKEHPYHAQLLMTVLQADSPAPKVMSDGGLYQHLRGAMGLDATTTGAP